MTASFIDTNVLVYAYDIDEPVKRSCALQLLESFAEADQLVLSTQVLQEFFVTVTRKLARPLVHEDAVEALEAWAAVPVVQVDAPLIIAAALSSREADLSFWDALILEAALTRKCSRVFTEDMQDGFEFKGLRVENPFGKPTLPLPEQDPP